MPDSKWKHGEPGGSVGHPTSGRSDFLSGLTREERDELARLGTEESFARGAFIYHAGTPATAAHVLVDGQVKIHQLSPAGRQVILWFCVQGEVFGLAEVAGGGNRAVSAQACTRSTVLSIPADAFRDYLAGHPRVAMLVMQVLSARMRVLGEIFTNLVSDDVQTRIAKLIVRLGAHYGVRAGGEIVLDIPLTHQEIADMVGTSRQTATSVLGALSRQGLLSVDNHRLRIRSDELLNDLNRAG